MRSRERPAGGRFLSGSDATVPCMNATGQPQARPIETPEGVTYHPWTDGYAVGFRCEQNGRVEFIYLNPSNGSDDGQPNVFVYHGEHGCPSKDAPAHFYEVLS